MDLLRHARPPQRTLLDRFEEKHVLNPVSGCWVWIGAVRSDGYGHIDVKRDGRRRMESAYRVSYELYIGPIPDGMTLDHLCRDPLCVNPRHLEVVTKRINTLRGKSCVAENARKTHCPAGHPYAGENLYRSPRGDRLCRACHREFTRQYERRQRARLVSA